MTAMYPTIISQEFRGMGTDLGLLIVAQSQEESQKATASIAAARALYVHYEKIFSRFDSTSELTHINNSLHTPIHASQEMLEVAEKALRYYALYDGLYDPRIITALEASGYAHDFQKQDFSPGNTLQSYDVSYPLAEDLIIDGEHITLHQRMDFAGIVKGYVTDKVSTFFLSEGWKDFLVDSGGDMYASGKPFDSEKWNIAVEGLDEGQIVFALSNQGVATSGISRRKWERDGKRFHHIINPKKPESFLFDVKTVSVIQSSTEEADVLAKVLFLKDDKERRAFASTHSIATLALYYNGGAWISSAAKNYCIQQST